MNEKQLRGLIGQVKDGKLSRRAFVQRMVAVGLTAPMAGQMLLHSGVAQAAAHSMYKPTKGNSTRVEFRWLDSASNPYLAFAVILAAGLKGIEDGYELPPGSEDDVWSLTPAERRAMGMEPLPGSLNQAIQAMERSELVAGALGEHVFDYFLRNKRAEWEEYRSNVTPFELKNYLSL